MNKKEKIFVQVIAKENVDDATETMKKIHNIFDIKENDIVSIKNYEEKKIQKILMKLSCWEKC